MRTALLVTLSLFAFCIVNAQSLDGDAAAQLTSRGSSTSGLFASTATGTTKVGVVYNTQYLIVNTGTDQIQFEKNIAAFPSPGGKKVTIEFQANRKPVSVSLTDLAGQPVMTQEINGRMLDLTEVPTGTYKLMIDGTNGEYFTMMKYHAED